MQPKITGENDERVGISVIDNNDVEHLIEMEFDGEIKYHEQDGYPDASEERSVEEAEAVAAARQYARYQVYRERGYPTLDPHRNPDRIAAMLVAIAQLPEERFEALFGEYYHQHAHHHQSGIEPPIEPPADVDADEFLRYELDVYLGVEEAAAEAIREFAEEADLAAVAGETLRTLAEPVEVALDPATDLGFAIDAVSDVRVAYQTGPGDEEVVEADAPIERAPDTIVQLVPLPSGSLAVFRRLLVHHLGCQIRDCYVEMDVEPPEPFRLLGHGFYESAQRYRLLDRYEPYFDFEADIPGYRTIDLGQDSPRP